MKKCIEKHVRPNNFFYMLTLTSPNPNLEQGYMEFKQAQQLLRKCCFSPTHMKVTSKTMVSKP